MHPQCISCPLQEFQLMHANMWWVRFSLSLSGDVLACGNGQGKMYVWNPNEMNAAAKAVLGTKACTRVVRAQHRQAQQ